MKRIAVIAAIAAALLLVAVSAHAWTGQCVGIMDGDTIEVMHDGKAERIRLYGIDCPEKKQPFGVAAKQFASALVFSRTVQVTPVTTDRYRRTVAAVSVDGRNVSEALVAAGLAWWYQKYAPADTRLGELEQRARQTRVGLWAMPNPIPPWEWRKIPKAKR